MKNKELILEFCDDMIMKIFLKIDELRNDGESALYNFNLLTQGNGRSYFIKNKTSEIVFLKRFDGEIEKYINTLINYDTSKFGFFTQSLQNLSKISINNLKKQKIVEKSSRIDKAKNLLLPYYIENDELLNSALGSKGKLILLNISSEGFDSKTITYVSNYVSKKKVYVSKKSEFIVIFKIRKKLMDFNPKIIELIFQYMECFPFFLIGQLKTGRISKFDQDIQITTKSSLEALEKLSKVKRISNPIIELNNLTMRYIDIFNEVVERSILEYRQEMISQISNRMAERV